jgi:hypothetical protein
MQKKRPGDCSPGHLLLLPFSLRKAVCLLEHAHDLVDDAKQNCIVAIIFFQRTEGSGVCVEGSKITCRIVNDHVSPVATAASP